MEISKQQIEQYLPTLEEFLTSVLLEETNISVASFTRMEKDSAPKESNSDDIFLYARERTFSADVIIVLDAEWFGILSSIMLGIEEKEKNEKTIELLQEFSSDLSEAVAGQAAGEGLEFEFEEARVLSKEEVEEELRHEEYFWTVFDIEGIADEAVRAEFFLGDPDTEIVREEPEAEEEPEQESAGEEPEVLDELSSLEDNEKEEAFEKTEGQQPREGRKEEVVSARHIEFAEFEEKNGSSDDKSHSMDLLKDVELDVSVELGRIELPLGKLLQLAKGSVIELEKLAGEPVDILVNGNRIALGEVVVIDEHFGVRISSLVTTKKRLATINGSAQ